MVIFKNKQILQSVAAVLSLLLLAGCSRTSPPAQKEAFIFDTYATFKDYSGSEENITPIYDTLSELSIEFGKAYGAEAASLSSAALSQCAAETAELNSIWGSTVNLTCGAVTELWSIPTENARIPDDSEISAALSKITEPSMYSGGDFSSFEKGTRLDFGAVSKGYACDKAYEALKNADIHSGFIVSLSSSTVFYGEKPDGSSFTAAVKNPLSPDEYLGTFVTGESFVSTSGGYERFFELDGKKYDHIISAETGYPVETDLLSVTVIVPAATKNGGILSDFIATSAYAEGTASLQKYLECSDFSIIAADKNNKVYISGGVDLTLNEKSGFVYAEQKNP